jgi:hypothetical protein
MTIFIGNPSWFFHPLVARASWASATHADAATYLLGNDNGAQQTSSPEMCGNVRKKCGKIRCDLMFPHEQ